MKAKAILIGLVLLAQATAVHAAGLKLAWDNCRGGGGAISKSFACNSNTAPAHELVASVVAPAGIGLWNSFEAEYIFRFSKLSPGGQPPWWQLRNQTGQTNQCRAGSLSANAIGAGLTGCTDNYAGSGAGGIGTYQNGPNIPAGEEGGPAPWLARLLLVFAIPAGNEAPLNEGEEYFVAKVVISNARTVNSPCNGCDREACIELVGVKIGQPAGAPGGNPEIRTNLPSYGSGQYAGWQVGPMGFYPCDGVTPARRETWGAIKSLYR